MKYENLQKTKKFLIMVTGSDWLYIRTSCNCYLGGNKMPVWLFSWNMLSCNMQHITFSINLINVENQQCSVVLGWSIWHGQTSRSLPHYTAGPDEQVHTCKPVHWKYSCVAHWSTSNSVRLLFHFYQWPRRNRCQHPYRHEWICHVWESGILACREPRPECTSLITSLFIFSLSLSLSPSFWAIASFLLLVYVLIPSCHIIYIYTYRVALKTPLPNIQVACQDENFTHTSWLIQWLNMCTSILLVIVCS